MPFIDIPEDIDEGPPDLTRCGAAVQLFFKNVQYLVNKQHLDRLTAVGLQQLVITLSSCCDTSLGTLKLAPDAHSRGARNWNWS